MNILPPPLTCRGARILTLLAIMGRDHYWLRRETRLGVNTIGRLLGDPQQTPSPRTLDAVARTLEVTTAWLEPDDARRILGAAEAGELRRCVRVLRAIARATRIDARGEPNVRPEPEPHTYRVVGHSLARAGLLDGDLATVRPAERVRDVSGAWVVARLNGSLYLKRLKVWMEGAIVLRSAADGYDPIVVGPADAFELLGEVVALAREYRSR
ncbi:MAG TPA: S24 family peptidase [Thermoanaerobaculia bacterium]